MSVMFCREIMSLPPQLGALRGRKGDNLINQYSSLFYVQDRSFTHNLINNFSKQLKVLKVTGDYK